VSDVERDNELLAIGPRLRQLRREHKLTTRALAQETGISSSMISQVENGNAQPSVASLRRIANVLNISLVEFFREPEASSPASPANSSSNGVAPHPGESQLRAFAEVVPGPGAVAVVRRDQRRRLQFPSSHVYELVSPNLAWPIEFLYVQLEAGHPPVESMAHPGYEIALVISGTLHAVVGDEEYILEAGDSIALDSSVPHRVENRGTEPVIQISAITPPRF
jgi:transcriptional regulator with XRE-family HTH domain